MQDPPTPAEDDLASIPMERVRDGPNLNRTFTERRKAAKRTFPWDLTADEIELALPRPRLEEPFPTSTYEATTENTSHDTTVALPPAPAAVSDNHRHHHADSDPVMDMHSNARATTVPRRSTPEEDAKLTSAATNSTRTKHDKECTTDSAAVAVLVPGRPSYSSIDPTLAQTGQWTTKGRWNTDEDTKLTDTVRMSMRICSNKNWPAISALVPGRTSKQCHDRWYSALTATIVQTPGCMGNWTADEDKKLRDAVPMHGGKNWEEIASLVPSRKKNLDALVSNTDPTTVRAGRWTETEDSRLKHSVKLHGGKDWAAIAVLVPGRTKKQCVVRWHTAFVSKNKPEVTRARKWTEDEDKKLRGAVPVQGDKNWKAVAALVPTRTQKQCRYRWYGSFVSNIDPATALGGKWTADEAKKLKDAVPAHGEKNWEEIAALVHGRTSQQCRSRWQNTLVSNVDPTTALGKWTADEDRKLVDVVNAHGGKNWLAIAALMPGRTVNKCLSRWQNTLVSNVDPTTALGKWTADEDRKLVDVVNAHGGKNWLAIAALMLGR